MKCLVLIFPFLFFLARMNWLIGSGFLLEKLMSQSYSSSLPYVIPEGWLRWSRETCYWILIRATWIQSTSTTPFRIKPVQRYSRVTTYVISVVSSRQVYQPKYYILTYAFRACYMFYPYCSAWIDSANSTRPLWTVQIMGVWEGGWVDDWCTVHWEITPHTIIKLSTSAQQFITVGLVFGLHVSTN